MNGIHYAAEETVFCIVVVVIKVNVFSVIYGGNDFCYLLIARFSGLFANHVRVKGQTRVGNFQINI